eukprot:CAMPEP_0172359420 /NCGR_PEP_ID=MMETSP1060-20121228/3627_1 /TAXON_ID=37318 /ORGANISM="Pseudo-nitzschia pungens, Strain cf. cingulata" /LENGTH=406 /DNA_ID=CAMNT_0013081063 /DNA_START=124 /DNA_END=1344 /DNA_ORIENTATION=+
MTAEFKSSGFSAVDKFFGGSDDNDNDNDKPDVEDTTKGNTATRSNLAVAAGKGRRRGGVGAALELERSTSHHQSTRGSFSSEGLAKQVLAVGRKRSRYTNDNDDDYGGDEAYNDHGIDDDNEGGGGRTAIARTKSRTKKPDYEPSKAAGTTTKATKKKLGKKERQRQKELADADADAIEVFAPVSEPKGSNGTDKNKTKNNDGAATEPFASDAAPETPKAATTAEHSKIASADSNPNSNSKPKKKRRKVRSRQKNIRKDHRSADEKPDHLIPGSGNYRGRPMTQATREKLNLPASNSSSNNNNNRKKRRFHKPGSSHGESNGDSLFVIDRSPETPSGDDLGVKLAIDEFLSGNGSGGGVSGGVSGGGDPTLGDSQTADSGKGTRKEGAAKESSSKSKKKKKRFKNL